MLGATIRLARERAGVSLDQLANDLNYSISTLNSVEQGRYRPGKSLLARLVQTFQFTEDEMQIINSEFYTARARTKPDRRRRPVKPNVLTFASAAKILQADYWRLLELVQAGELKVVDIRRPGAKRAVNRIPWASIEEFIARRTLDPAAQEQAFARYGHRN